jgi:chromosome partitioning protein
MVEGSTVSNSDLDDALRVSRETSGAQDTPIADAAATAIRVLSGRAGTLPRPPTTRVLTVANQKGGVGKTTSTVNLAAALALHGLRTLVIDLDPQGNASTALGIPHHAGTPSVYEVLIEGRPLSDVVHQVEGFPDLRAVPATIDLAGAEIELVSLVARETRLHRALTAYLSQEQGAGRTYDYVFVDCPPSLGLLTVNALVAAREVLIPIQAEYYALEGLGQLLRSIELVRAHLNPELAVSTILVTMYDARTRLAAQVADEVRKHFADLVLPTSIPRSVRVSEAPSYGQTVMTYDPGSTGALSYLEAARELARGVAPATRQDVAGQDPARQEAGQDSARQDAVHHDVGHHPPEGDAGSRNAGQG